ncbi:MAG: hypothetical protein ACXQT4_02810 [Methanotrichaceae archaeon]
MDVSYSAWRQVAEESLVLGGESFFFLFDRRYTNRLNKMSRVFFEAYVKATKEVSFEEDRFPSLSEIESRMESGAIYAYKDRLMRSTEFFEEVKISGISYLMPRAKTFVDKTGTYTDLILDFDEGLVILPKRRKVPLITELEDEAAKPEEESEFEREDLTEAAEEYLSEAESLESEEISEDELETKLRENEAEPVEKFEAEAEEIHTESKTAVYEDEAEKRSSEDESIFEELLEIPLPRANSEVRVRKIKIRGKSAAIAALVIFALISIYLLFPYVHLIFPFAPQVASSESVHYSAYLSNVSGNTYFTLDVSNPAGLENDIKMVLPPDIDKSISATGGVISISYSNSTEIRLLSSNDASISVCLSGDLEYVPVIFNVTVPTDFDSSLQVYEEDYQLMRKEDTIILMCNCTENHLEFEQVYHAKRVSGNSGAQEGSPENCTERQ